MDAIRQELERVYQLVTAEAHHQASAKLRQQQADIEEREAALAAAMELANVDPAVRAAFHDGILQERARWLALCEERMGYFKPDSSIYAVLLALQKVGGKE